MRKWLFSALADALTSVRIIIAIFLPFWGLVAGQSGLSRVILMVTVAWITDALDGPCARRGYPTRLGKYDFAIDALLTSSTLMYLAIVGYVPITLAAIYIVIGITIALMVKRKAIVIVFMRPIDVIGGVVALTYAPHQAYIMMVCLAGVLMVRWQQSIHRSHGWLRDLWSLLLGSKEKYP